MSNAAIAEAPPEITASDLTFVESFQAMMEGRSQVTDPVAPAAPEPEKPATPTPADPMERLDEVAKEANPGDPIELPTDLIDDEKPSTTADPEDKDNPYAPGSPQHARFRDMRKEAASLKATLDTEKQSRAQAEAQLKEFEAKAARTEELEAKVKEYESKLTLTDIKESPAYQEMVVKPLSDIIQRSDALAERIGVDPDDLANALEIADDRERRAKFKELTSGLDIDPDDHYEMRELASKVQPLRAKRDEIMANADTALAELNEQRTRQQQAELLKAAESRKATVDQVAERLTSKLPFLKSMDGVNFEEIVGKVKSTDPGAVPEHLREYNTVAGELLPHFIKKYAQLNKTVEELSDDLAAYRKQSPRMTPDSGSSRDTADDDDGILERFKKQFGG